MLETLSAGENRGEIPAFRPPDKRRPVLILTGSEVIDRLNEIIVVPITRTIRGLTTEVLLTPDDSLPVACVATADFLRCEILRCRAPC